MRFLTLLLGLSIASLLSGNSPAEAGCSGSGTTWSCTAGTTAAEINSAISLAADGATITLQAGSYSATGIDIGPRNGITIICATKGACTFTASGDVFVSDHSCPSARTNLMRISGMNFTGGSGGTAKIFLVCAYGQTWSKVRIDNNHFYNLGEGSIAILLGAAGRYAAMYGVVDHNEFGNGADANFIGFKNMEGGDSQDWLIDKHGTSSAMFFEDNYCHFGTDNPSAGGCIDSWQASSLVFRFNTLVNSRYVTHSYCHNGPYLQETYYNDISQPNSSPANYRNLHYQGSGEIIAFNNRIVGGHFAIQHFRADSSTATSEGNCNSVANGTVAIDGNRSPTSAYYGYPAWHQPGRDGKGKLRPIYDFRNFDQTNTLVVADFESGLWTGSGANCADSDSGRINCHIRKNRDIYQSVSLASQTSQSNPFNGTMGVGHGTLANRPSTCTTTPEALDAGNGGVGYWCTDCGNWNTSTSNSRGVQANGTSGQLYVCTATNTWSLYYTPYTYPHPLVSGGGGGTGGSGTTAPPPAPSNLTVQ